MSENDIHDIRNDIVYIDHMKIADVMASPSYANEQIIHHFWLCMLDEVFAFIILVLYVVL